LPFARARDAEYVLQFEVDVLDPGVRAEEGEEEDHGDHHDDLDVGPVPNQIMKSASATRGIPLNDVGIEHGGQGLASGQEEPEADATERAEDEPYRGLVEGDGGVVEDRSVQRHRDQVREEPEGARD